MKAKILCAHDLTDSSDAALRTALGLGRRLGAELTVLFASTPPYPSAAGLWYTLAPSFEGFEKRIREAARADLETRVKACTRRGDPPISLVADVRDPGEAILETVKALRPVLVVLGTHARTGWPHLLLGSVAERVVRESPVPVVTVRASIPAVNAGSALGPIVCATDLTEASRPALGQALRMADALHTELCVLYVSPPPFPDPSFRSFAVQEALALHGEGARVRRRAVAALADVVQGAKAAMGLPGVATRTLVMEGLPAETIVAHARAQGAQLIVLGTHGRTGLPHLLLGSVAERVMRTADRPVVTVAPDVVASRLDRVPGTPARSLPAP